jgi:hypothetical protein
MAVALVTFFTFDALAFPMATGVFFILLGAVGSMCRFYPKAQRAAASRPRGRAVVPAIYSAASVLIAIGSLVAINTARHVSPQYQAVGRIVLAGQPGVEGNVYLRSRYLGDFAQLLQRSITSAAGHEQIASAGGTASYEVGVGEGSLNPGTDIVGSGGVLTVESRSPSASDALTTTNAVMASITRDLTDWQESSGVTAQNSIRVQAAFPPSGAAPLPISARRAEVAYSLLVLWLGCIFARRFAKRFRLASVDSPDGDFADDRAALVTAAPRE